MLASSLMRLATAAAKGCGIQQHNCFRPRDLWATLRLSPMHVYLHSFMLPLFLLVITLSFRPAQSLPVSVVWSAS
jgi:hypothetical protein